LSLALVWIFNESTNSQIDLSQLADSLLEVVDSDPTIDAQTKTQIADSAFRIYERAGNICGQLRARQLQSMRMSDAGDPIKAIEHLIWVEKQFDPGCDSIILYGSLVNFTYIYESLGEWRRLDSIANHGIRIWKYREAYADKGLSLISNLAISKAYQGLNPEADSLFRVVLDLARKFEEKTFEQRALLNLATVYGMQEKLDSAYFFLDLAAHLSLEDYDPENHINIVFNLASLERGRGNHEKSMLLLDSVLAMATELENLDMMGEAWIGKAETSAASEDYVSAYESLFEHLDIRESYLNEKRVEAVAEMTEKYESEKKARQIQKLEIDNLDAALENEKVTQARNRMLFGGLGLLLVAGALWSRLRFVRRSRAAIRKERDVSDGLLLNILPEKVADELKEKGQAVAQHFDQVTVLFSDFKGFTSVAEQLTPGELVEEIDSCFKGFDAIMKRHGIEKIKTIGDAYMAAGGLPDPDFGQPADVVLAALEMQTFMDKRKSHLTGINKPAFDMRIGLHTGPVVAGIVGDTKFQYDIWGDAVNIAARMESSGDIGKVNISESSYKLLKEDPRFSFDFRGMVEAKGKGKLEMYFVSGVHNHV
jgi:class 3 adenylate cyclase/predicted negative regulator of RcsB-dependent stress response